MTQPNPANSPYAVVETPEFLGLVQDVLGSVEQWDDLKWAGDWLLEKNPTQGNYLPHHRLWVLIIDARPPVLVYYRLDAVSRQVRPVDIQIFPF